MEPCIFSANITISIVIPYLHTLVLIFTMQCVLYGKHTFVAFENVSVECICSVVLPELKDTCSLHISLFILDIYIRHYFYQSFLNKLMCWQTERFLVEDLLLFVYLFGVFCVLCFFFFFFNRLSVNFNLIEMNCNDVYNPRGKLVSFDFFW